MTQLLAERFESSGRPDTRRVLNFVAAQLLGQKGRQGQNPFSDLDVEKVMTAIELLGERRHLELAPFVYAWDPSVTDLEVPSYRPSSVIRDLRHGIAKSINSYEARDRELERPLAEFIRGVVGMGSNDGAVFQDELPPVQRTGRVWE